MRTRAIQLMKSQLMISVEGSQYALIGVFDSQSNTTSIPRKPERIQRPSPKTPANLRDGQQASVVKTQPWKVLSRSYLIINCGQIPFSTDRPNDSPFRPSFGGDTVAVVYRDTYRNHVAGSEAGRIDHGTLMQMSPFSDTVFDFENADIESLYISGRPGKCHIISF